MIICRGWGSPFKGFTHDFDFSCMWLRFLCKRGLEVCLASWAENGHKPAGPGDADPLNDSKEQMVSGIDKVIVRRLITVAGNTVVHVCTSTGREADTRSST